MRESTYRSRCQGTSPENEQADHEAGDAPDKQPQERRRVRGLAARELESGVAQAVEWRKDDVDHFSGATLMRGVHGSQHLSHPPRSTHEHPVEARERRVEK